MFKFEDLRTTYENFSPPKACIKIGGKDIVADKSDFTISNIEVELTSGFEASVAQFMIYNCYNPVTHQFNFTAIKKYVTIGSSVEISLGYGTALRDVFRGFISEVVFCFRQGEIPGVEVHAMDIKGIMMANNYAKQITAEYYSEAVKQILEQAFYQKLKGDTNVFNEMNIADTPDKPQGKKETTDRTIEMVNESDYEFVVRAAKRFNYEFFQLNDTIYFRRAKADNQLLMKIGPETGMMAFEIGYDVTGMIGKVEVRNTDPSKGKTVKYALKLEGSLSESGKAKGLVAKQTKVFIDPTAATQQEAEYRARYLREDMSYRFGTLEADMIGLPELVPGKFVQIDGLGKNVSNKFYLYSVRHSLQGDSFYQTHITGKAEGLPKSGV